MGYEYLAEWNVETEHHERKDHSHPFLKKQWVETRMNLGKSIDLYQIHSVTPESSVLNDKDVIKELSVNDLKIREFSRIKIGE